MITNDGFKYYFIDVYNSKIRPSTVHSRGTQQRGILNVI